MVNEGVNKIFLHMEDHLWTDLFTKTGSSSYIEIKQIDDLSDLFTYHMMMKFKFKFFYHHKGEPTCAIGRVFDTAAREVTITA